MRQCQSDKGHTTLNKVGNVLQYLQTKKDLPFEDLKDKLVFLFRALFLNSNLKPLKKIEQTSYLAEYFKYIEPMDISDLVEIYRSVDKLTLINLIYYALRLRKPNPGLSKLCISLLSGTPCDLDVVYRVILQNYLSDPRNSKTLDVLISYDSSIFCPFMYYIIASSSFKIETSSSELKARFGFLLKLLESHSDFLDHNAIYYIVTLLQEPIMETLEMEGSCEPIIFHFLLALTSLLDCLFEKGFGRDEITESNIDGLLQLAVLYQNITLPVYFSSLFEKDLEFTKNSLLSLENLLYNGFDNMIIPQELQLNQIYDYLVTFQSLLKYDVLEIQLFNRFNSLAIKLFNSIQISDFIISLLCRCIELIYSKPYSFCFDHLKILKQMVSYLSFTLCAPFRDNPYRVLCAMSYRYDDQISNLLNINKEKRFSFLSEIDRILKKNPNNPIKVLNDFYLNYPTLDGFNFNKLIYEFYLFDDIFKAKYIINSIKKFPKTLLKTFKEAKISTDCDSWPNNSFVKHFHKFFEERLSIKDYMFIKNDLTPMYPDSNILEIRLYLFILSINPQRKKELNPVNDALFLNVFKYYKADGYLEPALTDEPDNKLEEASDVCHFINEIFNIYEIPVSIINSIIDKICEQDTCASNILIFTRNNKNLMSKIYNSKNKFKILKKALIYKDIALFNLFILIQTRCNRNIIIQGDSNWFLELFKSTENSYLAWDPQDKYLFWESIFEVGTRRKNKLSCYVLNGFNLFFETIKDVEDYIYVDRRMAFRLSENEVHGLDDDSFNKLISEKVKVFNVEKADMKDLKKSSKDNLKSKKKAIDDNDEILKSKDIEVDSGETLHVSITVYPNGKKEDALQSEIDQLHTKKLTQNERKSLFLDEVKTSKITTAKNKSKITKYSDYILRPIINDIFKCVFKEHDKFTGKFIGFVFGAPKINFSIVEDDKIKSVLEKFKVEDNKFLNFLYIKFVAYLFNRKFESSILKKKKEEIERSYSQQ